MTDLIRPKTASKRYEVSISTLAEWARGGLIGRTKVERAVWYSAREIEDLLAAHTTPRTMTPRVALPSVEAWPLEDLWRGTVLDPEARR